ncbi:hypothetical protein ILYODFUR_007329 [Ilyodon furcidens]|uniref:Uncharacterized protein n=1 Tax=Ilyodon furcidens TaxID=33524 RepID=A0ABV0SJ90_9TELE
MIGLLSSERNLARQEEDQTKQTKYQAEVHGCNTAQEPCGRRVIGISYSQAASPSPFSRPSPVLFFRGSPCYELQLCWLQQAV